MAGHSGMVGSAIVRKLNDVENVEIILRSRNELDLTNQYDVRDFFAAERPDVVILAAARVGGIYANNTFPAEFIYQNMMIQFNVIHHSYLAGVERLLQLGSSCIYPKDASQPMVESELLNGHLEVTNEPYAVAKIAGIKLCESYNRQYNTDFRSVMPTNLYGPGDLNRDRLINGFIISIIKKKIFKIRSSGKLVRDYLYIDDAVNAYYLTMKSLINGKQNLRVYNVGSKYNMNVFKMINKISKIINKDRNYILLNSNDFINKNDLNNFYKLIHQRSLGNPVAYLTKKKSFWNSDFFITKDILIPRPDTELIVENILSLTKQKSKIIQRIL